MKKKTFVLFAGTALFFLASCGGDKKPVTDQTQTTVDTVSKTTTATTESGKDIYARTCKACHQENGAGIAKTFPPLLNSDFLANKDNVIDQVINGKKGEMVVNGETYNNTMPPQALSDEEIASVLNYVYSGLNNSETTVSAAEVKAIREKAK